jgi:RNA-directed DNA polymerase
MAVISPILANVYLHYVFDLWTHRWRRKATGDVIVIRYADYNILGFAPDSEEACAKGSQLTRLKPCHRT